MWSIHRGQKSNHITPTPKRPPLGTPPAAARQLNAQRSGFIVGECCRAQRIFNLNDCRWQSYLDSLTNRPLAPSPVAPHLPLPPGSHRTHASLVQREVAKIGSS